MWANRRQSRCKLKKAGWFKKSPAFLAGDFSLPWKALYMIA